MPDEDTDVKYHLMYTLRKFFGDLNFESGDLFGRLKSSFEQESTKWEIMEIVFLVAFICQPGYCECGEKISHFYGLLDMDDSLPIVIKMVLRILMRSIEKMDLKGLVNDLTPFRPMKKRFQVSTGTKRKRQEELLSELEQEKTENKKMRKRLKELEIEISELLKQKSIITLMDNDIGNNNYNSELQHLKERLENEQENRETKNRKITELNQEISRLNDDLDLVNCKLNEYKMRETRYLSYNKKFEKINKMEAVIKELTEQYNQSAEDKNVLLSEIQRLRINSRTSECLSKEINDVNDRYLKALGEINDLNRHNENLRNLLGQRTEKIKILENELNLLRNKLETPLASQRNSLGTEVPSL